MWFRDSSRSTRRLATDPTQLFQESCAYSGCKLLFIPSWQWTIIWLYAHMRAEQQVWHVDGNLLARVAVRQAQAQPCTAALPACNCSIPGLRHWLQELKRSQGAGRDEAASLRAALRQAHANSPAASQLSAAQAELESLRCTVLLLCFHCTSCPCPAFRSHSSGGREQA